jgi:hypothetical protein
LWGSFIQGFDKRIELEDESVDGLLQRVQPAGVTGEGVEQRVQPGLDLSDAVVLFQVYE